MRLRTVGAAHAVNHKDRVYPEFMHPWIYCSFRLPTRARSSRASPGRACRHSEVLQLWTSERRVKKRGGEAMIRKLKSGEYRLYSRKKDSKTGKRRNLGTFKNREAAEQHERAVQFFKRRG